MPYKSFLIADQKTGLELDKEPFLLPEEAYAVLENAYVWRSRLKKKSANKLLGRLRRVFTAVGIGLTGASPWAFTLYSVVAPVINDGSQQQIEPGSVVITFGGITLTDQGDGTLTSPTPGNSGTINYTTGAIVLTHTAGAGVAATASFAYFPGLPVMGIPTRLLESTNAEQTLAFDTRYAYVYNNSTNAWNEFITGTTWTGTNADFFWSLSYRRVGAVTVFWTTNYYLATPLDPIRYTPDGTIWRTFAPLIDATDSLQQCKMLMPQKGYLLAISTVEGVDSSNYTVYPQRVRWSQFGNPLVDPVDGGDADAWREDIIGRGGHEDVPTGEHIISAAFLKDTLIIYCETSTWRFRFTNNQVQPFVFERVNAEFGSEGKMSSVFFDAGPVTIGNRGITQTDGVNAQRIDLKIPDEVFGFHNENSGPERVYGIRDFDEQVVYWAFPNDDENGTYPNRILLYNYRDQNWAILRDSFTALGYWQSFADLTWGEAISLWGESNFLWNSNKNQALYPKVVGGNQQGFVNILQEVEVGEANLRIESITIADPMVVTSTAHNLSTGDYVRFLNVVATGLTTELNNFIFMVERVTADTLRLFRKARFTITGITQATSAVVTVPGHNFTPGDLAQFRELAGMVEINGITARVLATTANTVTIDLDTSAFTAYISGGNAENLMSPMQLVSQTAGTFSGYGEMARVDTMTVRTKQFNPALSEGRSTRIGWSEYYFDATPSGKFTLNIYVDGNQNTPVNAPSTDAQESNVVETYENNFEQTGQEKLWHGQFDSCVGNFFQLEYSLSEAQMTSLQISSSPFVLHAASVWAEPSNERLS